MLRELNIDILESHLHKKGGLLDILLVDRTTNNNIIWATDDYASNGAELEAQKQIKKELITGKFDKLIQPRAAKSKEGQDKRRKEKAEVFTPLYIVDKMNKSVDDTALKKSDWQGYIRQDKLEITCGEAPFIVSRYNPVSNTGKVIKLDRRVGFLDRKLQVVSKHCDSEQKWVYWAKEAYKSSYGYDWQGDNVLIARENLLYTFIDCYYDKFGKTPSLKLQKSIAEIVSWNIFQMDGLKMVIPMSCHQEKVVKKGEKTLFNEVEDQICFVECEGCKINNNSKHNGEYVKIMDWKAGEVVKFVDLFYI